MAEEKKIKTVEDFIRNCHELTPEDYAVELKQFSAIERANILATEYISKMDYPAGKFDRENIKVSLNIGGKIYYPIVGWNPDLTNPYAGEMKISPMRKWLNRLPKRKIHNSREDRTYVLYG